MGLTLKDRRMEFDLPPLPIKDFLLEYNLHAKKSLGQNFLFDSGSLSKIVRGSDVTKDDVVLEIGAGMGSLTRFLGLAAKRVVAVEIDQKMLPILDQVLFPFKNVEIVHGDMLELDPAELMNGEDYICIANIPYYITSALMRHLLESSLRPKRIVFTMQTEVASRICAKEGKLSLLALSVQVYGAPRVVAKLPAGAFYPPPKVDSATLRVDLFDEPRIPQEHIDTFFKLAKAGFSQKRKNLRNSLSGGLHISKEEVEKMLGKAEIDTSRRAETLSIEEWGKLTEIYTESR